MWIKKQIIIQTNGYVSSFNNNIKKTICYWQSIQCFSTVKPTYYLHNQILLFLESQANFTMQNNNEIHSLKYVL